MWNSWVRLHEYVHQTITSSTITFMSQLLKTKILLGITEWWRCSAQSSVTFGEVRTVLTWSLANTSVSIRLLHWWAFTGYNIFPMGRQLGLTEAEISRPAVPRNYLTRGYSWLKLIFSVWVLHLSISLRITCKRQCPHFNYLFFQKIIQLLFRVTETDYFGLVSLCIFTITAPSSQPIVLVTYGGPLGLTQ